MVGRQKEKFIKEPSSSFSSINYILSYISDAVICLNYKNEIIDINPVAELFYGWKKKQS